MAKGNRQDRASRGRQNVGRTRAPNLPGDDLGLARPRAFAAKKPLEAKTPAQAAYINAINTYSLVFCKGPAGTGKTFVPAAMAAAAIASKQIEKIIITRPAIGAEEELGFFPGTLKEKVAPWAAPVVKILEQRLGVGAVEYMLASDQIEIAPLGMLRGHTFENAFVIFDEAQNTTSNQMELFLTRIGENVKVVVDGDPARQKDIPGISGFDDAWRVMENHRSVGFVEFTIDDIVRSGLCRDILIRYAERNSAVGHAELRSILARSPSR